MMGTTIRATILALVALPLLTGGCAYTGSDNPLARKASWYDYLDGGDIRAACRPGAPDRYRLVHNAIHVEQVRTYEIQATPGGGSLDARVLGPADLSSLAVRSLGDLAAPWKGRTARTALRPADMDTLRAALETSGVFGPAPAGLRLDSDGFFWTVAACRDGAFAFNAYRWPSPRWEAMAFPPPLFGWDGTGVRVNPPRQATALDIHGSMKAEGAVRYEVEVGRDGLLGARPLF